LTVLSLAFSLTNGEEKKDASKVNTKLLDGESLKDVIESTDEMIVIGLTSLDPKECGKECDDLVTMFNEMGPTMKGFFDSYLLEASSAFEDQKGKMTTLFDYFNITNRELPSIFVFPYGGKSISISKPANRSNDVVGMMTSEELVVHTAHVKLHESSHPLQLNSTYATKLTQSYAKRPKSVHTIFLQQLPNRVDILDGNNVTKWVSEVLPKRKDWSARAILASSQDMIPPLYTKLAINFCCSGRIRFGFIKAKDPNSKAALDQLKITKFPTLMIGKDHDLGTDKSDVYTGKLKLDALNEWALGYDASRSPDNIVKELTDESVMQRECHKQPGWCIIAVIPDDPDTMEENVETFRAVAGRRYPPTIPARFLWLHAGKQEKFLETWVGEVNFDEPAIIAIKTKGITPMYHVYQQATYNPKDIRKETFDVLFEQATFMHLEAKEKMPMLRRERPTDLSRVADEALEREEADIEREARETAADRDDV